ncbi:MAG: cobalamin biosynthesis protein CobQ [Cyanobacteria bacterium QS_8_64_29]|nr:MAG: cobalamin biosynthesis protein CobQ [Cyanobacteria bacterium QS_8_64_29]
MSSDAGLLRIGWLYPTLMSTYGDRGNVICLQRRCQWRQIPVEVVPLDRDAPSERFGSVDLVVGGGAQDRQQAIVMRDLQGAKADALRQGLEAGMPGAFTCGAPQLLGHYYEPALGECIPGLGLFDFSSHHPGEGAPRCIGNLAFEITAEPLASQLRALWGAPPIAIGFENHGGRTQLAMATPLGRVRYGYGNNGRDGTEGAIRHNAIATYSHGPLLPKNPFLADWLMQTAWQQKYGEAVPLPALDDALAVRAREVMFERLGLAPQREAA